MENKILQLKSLFWGNKTIRQTIFKNTFWLMLAEVVNKILKVFLLIYVAKIFGPAEYGKFSFALSFIALFVFFPNFIFPSIVIREFSGEKEKDFSPVLTLRMLFNISALVFIIAGSFFITQDILARNLILILAFYMQIDSLCDFLSLFFQAKQRMEYQSFSEILRTILLVGFSLFLIFKYPSIQNLGYGYLASGIISLFIILVFFHKKIHPLSINLSKETWKKYLSLSWPLALTSLSVSFSGQIDSVIMGHMNLLSQTGFYNAASKIVVGISIPMGLMSTTFYPAMNKAFIGGKEIFQKMWDFQIDLIIFLVLPFLAGSIVLAPRIINFVYGRNYFPSILAFQILLFPAVVAFISKPFAHALYILDKQKNFLWISLAGAVINVILNLLFIPRFGLYGAAVVSAISYSATFIIMALIVRKFISIIIFDFQFFITLIISGIACTIMYFTVSSPGIYNLHVIFTVLIGVVVYSSIFFMSKFLLKNLGLIKEIF